MYQALEAKTWASKGYKQRESEIERKGEGIGRDALRLSQRERDEGQHEE